MRILIAARLSQTGKGQTGIDTQDIDARHWAEIRGHEVVGIAADKISGRVDPQKRPNLGPWLTDPKLMAQYDAVLASKMDRFTRGRDWKMREWAEKNGKKLIVVQNELTWPPEPGDIITPQLWDMLVNQSAAEWENTSQRYRRMHTGLIADGFLVGRPMFGLQVVPVPGTDHSTLAPDPALVDYIRGMVARALNGDSLSSIGAWLESVGINPPAGGQWSPKSISQILRNKGLIGRRDNSKGVTVLWFDSIIDGATFDKLQAKLDSNPKRRGPVSSAPALLTGVIYCNKCEGIMHRRRTVTKRKDGSSTAHETYRCDGLPRTPSTCKNMLPRADMEAWVNAWFTIGPIANKEYRDIRTIPGHAHGEELDRNARDIDGLDKSAPGYRNRLNDLLDERERLEALPPVGSRVVEEGTGILIRDYWEGLSTAERRALMMNNGIKLYAERGFMRFNTGVTPSVAAWWGVVDDWDYTLAA